MFDLDALRLHQMPLRDARDRLRHRGGEERHLARRGDEREHALDLIDESHFQHLVCFVEDDHAHLGEIERAAVEVIDEAPRRSDDDVRAALQMLHLSEDRRAAVDGEDRHAIEFFRIRMHGVA